MPRKNVFDMPFSVDTIEDPMTKKMRQLDKLIDDLAKGKPIVMKGISL